MSDSLDPDQDLLVSDMLLLSDQAQCFVGPDLGANCLQRLPADDKKSL